MRPAFIMSDILKVRTNSSNKLNVLFGLYDVKLVIRNTNFYVHIGAGSLNALPIIRELSTNVQYDGEIASIGRYCDFNRSSKLVFAGEHNPKSFIGLTGSPLLKSATERFGIRHISSPKSATTIGHQCVFSTDSTILSGSSIANHSLVGAGALVTSKHESSGTLVGIPAKLKPLKYNGPLVDYFKFHPVALFKKLQMAKQNQNLKQALREIQTDKVFSEVLVIEASYGQGKLLDIVVKGLEKHGLFKELKSLSKRTNDSVEQLSSTNSDVEVDLDLFRDF